MPPGGQTLDRLERSFQVRIERLIDQGMSRVLGRRRTHKKKQRRQVSNLPSRGQTLDRFKRFVSVAMAVRLHVLVSQTHVHFHELLSWVITREAASVQW